MATGSVLTGVVDAGTALLGAGSTSVLLSVVLPTNGRIICTPHVTYQHTTATGAGYKRLYALVGKDSGSASISATGGTAGTVDVGWDSEGLTMAVSGSTFKVTVEAAEGETRFWGYLEVLQVEQPVVVA